MNIKTQHGDIIVLRDSFRLVSSQRNSLHEIALVSLDKPNTNFLVVFSSKDSEIADAVFKQACNLIFKIPSAQSLDFMRMGSKESIEAFNNYYQNKGNSTKSRRGRPKK